MKHFTYTTQIIDYGLSCETIDTLQVEAVGCITLNSSNYSSEVKYSGNNSKDNTGALLEAIDFINNAKRNSKTLKIDSTAQSDGITTIKGSINIQRFIW